MSNSIEALQNSVSELIEKFLKDNGCLKVSAAHLDLDPRSAYSVYVCRDFIAAANSNVRTMNYYGGFEYVIPDFATSLGDYTIWSADDDRVAEAIKYFYTDSDYFETETETE